MTLDEIEKLTPYQRSEALARLMETPPEGEVSDAFQDERAGVLSKGGWWESIDTDASLFSIHKKWTPRYLFWNDWNTTDQFFGMWRAIDCLQKRGYGILISAFPDESSVTLYWDKGANFIDIKSHNEIPEKVCILALYALTQKPAE